MRCARRRTAEEVSDSLSNRPEELLALLDSVARDLLRGRERVLGLLLRRLGAAASAGGARREASAGVGVRGAAGTEGVCEAERAHHGG